MGHSEFNPRVVSHRDPEEASSDADRRRRRRRKVSCFLLLALFGVVFLIGVVILSLRQTGTHQEEEKKEEQRKATTSSVSERVRTITFPQNFGEKTTILSATFDGGKFLDAKAEELRQGLDKGIMDSDSVVRDERFRRDYEKFWFHNMTSSDLAYATKFVRNHINTSKPLLVKEKINPEIKRVVDALAINVKSGHKSEPLPSEDSLPQLLVFDKPTVFEERMKEMRSKLHELFQAIKELPEEIQPDGDVLEYLNINSQYADDEEKPTIEENLEIPIPTKFIQHMIDLGNNSIPHSRSGRCREGETVCGVNQTECFDASQRCNNIVDCSDNADEIYCPRCHTFLRDGSNKDSSFECDGVYDCVDGSDEAKCEKECEEPDYFRCKSSKVCLPESKRCNFIKDCLDGSDEIGCVALWPEPVDPDSSAIASPFSHGVLHWKVNQTWRVLSVSTEDKDSFMESISRSICTEILLNNVGALPNDHKIRHIFRKSDSMVNPRSRAHLLVNRAFVEMENAEYDFHFGPKPDDAVNVLMDCGATECGTRPYAYEPEQADITDFFKSRIVGGTASVPFDWPSVVGVYIDGYLLCGGTLIRTNWVLSAAHCFKSVKERESVVEIVSGMSRVNSRSPFTQIRQVSEIISHGHFNKTYLTHDVVLLYFEEPIPLNARVNLACLNREESRPLKKETCKAVGWGSTHESENFVNNELLEVDVPIKNSCVQSYNDLTHQICGGFYTGGKDACQGDSGGPLYCSSSSSGEGDFAKHYLAGIVSHGIGCARPEVDGVYVRITYYLDWIDSVMNIKTYQIKYKRIKRRVPERPNSRKGFRGAADYKYPNLPYRHMMMNSDCPSGVRCDGNRCISESHICDGRFHCMDSMDELDCKQDADGERVHVPGYWTSNFPLFTSTTEASTTFRSTVNIVNVSKPIKEMSVFRKPEDCEEGFFTCRQIRECIPDSFKCDLKKDCLDGSDEIECKCRDYMKEGDKRVCDGVPDCPDASDENDCHNCASNQFFCRLSDTCIDKSKVCNREVDCKFKEDERHCIAVVPYRKNEGIKLIYSNENKIPLRYHSGYVALNHEGKWNPLCLKNEFTWTKEMNDRVCNYHGFLRGEDYNYVSSEEIPDEEFLMSPLSVTYADGSLLSSPRDSKLFCDSGVVQTTCSKSTRCGMHPLYSSVDDYQKFDKLDKEGLFPWQVTLYQEGNYVCGATLIHRNWIMTSTECSSMMNPKSNYVVARMGAHRAGRFSSPHEQIRQVIQFTRVPHTGISLGTFRNAVELGNYINPICIPSSNWFPFKGKCVITGFDRNTGILNRGVKMTVNEICEVNAIYDYSVCADPVNENEDVCMDNWSGTLSCLDQSNRYYVLGVYHTSDGGCRDPTATGGHLSIPTKFRSVSTTTARDAIRKIVGVFNANESVWYDINHGCSTHRCPLGKCLKASQICDGVPNCEDLSDESEKLCRANQGNKGLRAGFQCASLNSTHCACESGQFMCKKTGLCVNRNKFCDGVDDCGDLSDEPEGCGVCVNALQTLEPHAICDGKIDCLDSPNSVGSDESANICCGGQNSSSHFRCVLGNAKSGNYDNLNINNDCVEKSSICDHCKDQSSKNCYNGADDIDCLTISPREKSSFADDVFGRPESQPQGYLHYISYGKKYLYCAGKHFYGVLESDSVIRAEATRILCKHEGYNEGGHLTFHQTVEKHYVYSYEDKQDYESCKLVYIVCGNRRQSY